MLILKSASPRRKQILKDLNLKFKIEPAELNEEIHINELPLSYLKRITIAKLELETVQSGCTYISSDTIVVLGDRILSKPRDFAEGVEILSSLTGKIHSVYSGLGICKNGRTFFDFDETKVTFKDWKEKEIKLYLDTAKPFDKAGSYGIQDKNGPVLNYVGSYSNVLGFPLRKFYLEVGAWKEYLS